MQLLRVPFSHHWQRSSRCRSSSGFADAHATAVSAASLLAAGKIEIRQAIVPVLVGLTTNTVTEAVVAFNSGGKACALQVVPGLVSMMAAVWLGAWLIL